MKKHKQLENWNGHMHMGAMKWILNDRFPDTRFHYIDGNGSIFDIRENREPHWIELYAAQRYKLLVLFQDDLQCELYEEMKRKFNNEKT